MSIEAMRSIPEPSRWTLKEINPEDLALGAVFGMLGALFVAWRVYGGFTWRWAIFLPSGVAVGSLSSYAVQKAVLGIVHPTKRYRESPFPRFKKPAAKEISEILQELENESWFSTWKALPRERRGGLRDFLTFCVSQAETPEKHLAVQLEKGLCFGICQVLLRRQQEWVSAPLRELPGVLTQRRREIVRTQILEQCRSELWNSGEENASLLIENAQNHGLKKHAAAPDSGVANFILSEGCHMVAWVGNTLVDTYSEETGIYLFPDINKGLKAHLESYGISRDDIEYWSLS